jgi:hypothetical protein
MKVISPESIVEIKVSGAFYARLQQLAIHNMDGKTTEDVQKAMQLLQEGKFEDPWSYHYATIVVLLSTIENEAVKQNKVVEKEITDDIIIPDRPAAEESNS